MTRYKKPKWKRCTLINTHWLLETRNFTALVYYVGKGSARVAEWDVFDKVSEEEAWGTVPTLKEGKRMAINAILSLSTKSLKILSQRADWADVDIEHLRNEVDKELPTKVSRNTK